ncbi:glycosyltransferase [Lyngbya sp. PCC 8106]|uniref:glycosyltransferase family 2 protein n=1 Tax=Lyngbya sp. (strain PCC 8106) TaxID=313612 RepID=UPI0000EAA1D1|nr:cellulose synthase catalytic subunit [Lyngbya sp. PCC 8106]EAW37726.1 UDP-glucose-beta-D-glucan glucosyltransferase [Lyngbya sp. PCC 8106]
MISESKQRLKIALWFTSRPHTATLVLLTTITLFAVITGGWFFGEENISQFFAYIDLGQQNPPFWIQPPEINQKYLLLPTIVFVTTVFTIIKLSPKPKLWSRTIIIAIVLALIIRYILWRTLSTLNLSDPMNGTFSLGLLFLEVLIWISGGIRLWLVLKMKDRSQQANQMEINVREGKFLPTVDILIPTYQESTSIVKRTIIGCQAIDYPNKKVYLLDDSQRLEVKQLAQELGCNYIARSENSHAKAGNLNHALPLTSGELIVVFDADFIPTRNFLDRTIGFFQNKKVALVQTPQSFYNPDPIAKNLGLEKVLISDDEEFYRHIELLKDGVNSTVCAGTSFVMRRKALEEIGGFVTESISEDYFTGIRLSAQGYQLVYLREKLSAGLAAEDITNYFVQRKRWGRGTLQAFFINSNPLTIPGLKLSQRLAHLEGLVNWLSVWAYPYFFLMPLAYAFLGVLPIQATVEEWLYFFIPCYWVQIIVFRWLNERSRSVIISEIYKTVLCFPLSLSVFLVMLNPFKHKFQVTQKGISSQRFSFNWTLGWPLILLFIATLIGLLRILRIWGTVPITAEVAEFTQDAFDLGLIWTVYNLLSIGVALLALIDTPKSDLYDGFDLRRIVRLKLGDQTLWGITTKISEVEAEIQLTQKLSSPIQPNNFLSSHQGFPVKLHIVDEGLKLTAEMTNYTFIDSFPTLKVKFKHITLSQYRQLITMLFCQPGQWKERETPGELYSLFLVLKTLLNPPLVQSYRRKFTKAKKLKF